MLDIQVQNVLYLKQMISKVSPLSYMISGPKRLIHLYTIGREGDSTCNTIAVLHVFTMEVN